jgi:hypothetical protein
MQSPPRHYQPKILYPQPSAQHSQQQHFQAEQQPSSFFQPSTQRPRIRKPLIETHESPSRTPKTTPQQVATPPQKSTRGRKPKNRDVEPVKLADESIDENEEGEIEGVDYITRCICGLKHNDPNMIACDSCEVWQHMICMGLNPKSRLENSTYKCELCLPRTLKPSREEAASIQRKYLAELKRKSGAKTPASSSTKPKKQKDPDERRTSTSMTPGKPETKFAETKITRGIRKILGQLSSVSLTIFND